MYEYIWLDINNNHRSKTKIVSLKRDEWSQGDSKYSDPPEWNYDGSGKGC